MEKHLLISKGCKGWGGPLTITPGQGKKIAYITGGIRPPVVDRLSELTGWPSIDVFKNGEPCEEPTYLILTRNTGSSGNKSKQLGIFRSLQVGIEKNNVTFYLIPYLWIT